MPMASLAGRSSPGKHQTVSQSCSAPLPRAEPSDSILLSYQRGALLHFFFSSRRRHTRWNCDWSSDVGSSDLATPEGAESVPVMPDIPPKDEAGALAVRDRARIAPGVTNILVSPDEKGAMLSAG